MHKVKLEQPIIIPFIMEVNMNCNINKFYDDEQLVFGWASVSKDAKGNRPLDWHGDLIDVEDLEKAVYDF